MTSKVLLSFDTEEFDFPRERGETFSLKEGIKVSKEGTLKILKILKDTNVKATFFVTGNFAKNEPSLIKEIIKDGHEVAAHGIDHFKPKKSDIKEAKAALEKITGKKVRGWRQPRMQKIDYQELVQNHYHYDSSVNPAFIPGRYNNANISRTPFLISVNNKTPQNKPAKSSKNTILEIPASTATFMRIPLFWLALHLFPFWFYKTLANNSLKKTGLLVTYFHPWEFTDLSKFKIVPWYIKRNSNAKLEKRLEKLIIYLKKQNCTFIKYSDYQLQK